MSVSRRRRGDRVGLPRWAGLAGLVLSGVAHAGPAGAPVAPKPAAAPTAPAAPAPAPAPTTPLVPTPAPKATAKAAPSPTATSTPAATASPPAATAEVASEAEAPDDPLDLRLTMSSFLYRESGADAPAVVDRGAELENASPVKRYFGDLRLQLDRAGLAIDTRVRQTTSQRFQSGAVGGSEYELRALAYRLGSARTSATVGRQLIDEAGASRIDGVAGRRQLTTLASAVVFVGALPLLGSRSLATDYPRLRDDTGALGAPLVPAIAGLGARYQGADLHGSLGLAGVYVAQEVADATAAERTRVFASSSGYWRPAAIADLYHYAVVEVSGQAGGRLTNGSLGLDLRPTPAVQVTASVHHVATEVFELTARDLLADPDPAAGPIVQNDLTLIQSSQDAARVGASLALARGRFELSGHAGAQRRPELAVALADGSGQLAFPEARSVEAGFEVVDRRLAGKVRVSLGGQVSRPVGDQLASRARSELLRVLVRAPFAADRGEADVDVSAYHFADVRPAAACTNLAALSCLGAAETRAAQVGALVSWRVGAEWVVLADAHVGVRDSTSTNLTSMVTWPRVVAFTGLLRLQWRYR